MQHIHFFYMALGENPHQKGTADAEFWEQAKNMVLDDKNPPPTGSVDCIIASLRDNLADKANSEQRRATAERGSR